MRIENTGVAVDPKDDNVVYSCSTVLWRTEDSGQTWSAVRGAPGGDDYQNVWINPKDPDIILFASDQGATISVNRGQTWGAWIVGVLGLSVGAGVGLALRPGRRDPPAPDPAAVVTRVREVARLETLDVTLYRKITFAPEPTEAGTPWAELAGWLRHTFRTPRGKAIVFADAHVGLDLSHLDASAVRVTGRTVEVVLPPVRATVELRPGETEVIDSNLDSAETARLFDLAKIAFEREVSADAALRARARASAERQIRALLLTLGFAEVHFVDVLPAGAAST